MRAAAIWRVGAIISNDLWPGSWPFVDHCEPRADGDILRWRLNDHAAIAGTARLRAALGRSFRILLRRRNKKRRDAGGGGGKKHLRVGCRQRWRPRIEPGGAGQRAGIESQSRKAAKAPGKPGKRQRPGRRLRRHGHDPHRAIRLTGQRLAQGELRRNLLKIGAAAAIGKKNPIRQIRAQNIEFSIQRVVVSRRDGDKNAGDAAAGARQAA